MNECAVTYDQLMDPDPTDKHQPDFSRPEFPEGWPELDCFEEDGSLSESLPQERGKRNKVLLEKYDAFKQKGDIQRANKIAWELVLANTGLIRCIAKPLFKKFQCAEKAMELDDLVSAGFDGLRHALKRFDSQKGSFSTYAAWWIREYIIRYIFNNMKIIRMPRYLIHKLYTIRQIEDLFIVNDEMRCSDRLVADRLGWDEQEVVKIRSTDISTVSFDMQAKIPDEDDKNDFYNFYADTSTPNPEERVLVSSERKIINMLLQEASAWKKGLSRRERIVLRLRYGFNGSMEKIPTNGKYKRKTKKVPETEVNYDGCEKTLEEISNILGTTRERIRQIEEKALGIIRKMYVKKHIPL